jgi:hypothetical protein
LKIVLLLILNDKNIIFKIAQPVVLFSGATIAKTGEVTKRKNLNTEK